MQIPLLLLILALFMHDEVLAPPGASPPLGGWALAMAVILPKLALVGGYWLACRRTLARLGGPNTQRAMRQMDRVGVLYRGGAVGLYLVDLYLGLLVALRNLTGDPLLADELLVLAVPVGLIILGWWIYYPIERRVREAALIGRLDAGLPIYPVWTRGQYVVAQARHHLALILVPLLLIFAWSQVVERYTPAHWQVLGHSPEPLLMFLGSACVFVFAPLIIRHAWDTVPLPAGELRDRLEAMCRRHGVGVRDLLLWRTFGGMINAAVMGLAAPLRYILLTDALLEMVRREQVEAVMAHELAHVRRHHMFWLIVVALGLLGALQLMFGVLMLSLAAALPGPSDTHGPQLVTAGFSQGVTDVLRSEEGIIGITLLATGVCWAVGFGWVSRRIERQADTFAVQHMVETREVPERDTAGRLIVDAASAQTMILALQQVAVLNQVPVHRRSWRHGSIASRQAYLRSIVGQPIDRLSVDRQMRWIKLGALTLLLAVIGAYVAMSWLVPATGQAAL